MWPFKSKSPDCPVSKSGRHHFHSDGSPTEMTRSYDLCEKGVDLFPWKSTEYCCHCSAKFTRVKEDFWDRGKIIPK